MSATITSMGGMDPILGKNLGKNQNSEPAKANNPAPNTKPLWATIGIMGVSILALGASLIHINKRPAEPTAMASNASVQRASVNGNPTGLTVPSGSTGLDGGNSMITETKDGRTIPPTAKTHDSVTKPVPKKVVKQAEQRVAVAPVSPAAPAAPATPAPTAANPPVINSGLPPVAATTPQPTVQATPAPVVAQESPKPVCANCGTIEAVTPITRAGKGGSGVGTVAGGVLGGVLGRQVGSGTGKDLATVIGAVGGAVAGNAVEKNIKKETVYSVRVHMQDGSTRTVEQASAPAVGSKVRVEGNTLRADS
jgi:outer membrane lipoprotein SlyB